MRNTLILFVWVFLLSCMGPDTKSFEVAFTPSADLEADFVAPPDYAKPRVYWWWLEGNNSKEGILSDLSEMKKVGIQGAILFDAGSSSYAGMKRTEPGPVFMGAEWRELFTYACRVADSLDMEISLNIGSGWNDGGPWVTPELASKKMVWSELSVQGPKQLSEQLPMPEGLLKEEQTGSPYYRPIAVLAVKLAANNSTVKPLENGDIKAVHSIRIPQTTNGLGYDWDVFMKEEPSPEGDCHAGLPDVVNITDKMDETGHITWQVPEGNYLIMRFGYTGTGIKVSTHSPGSGGLAIDYMDTRAMDLQYDHTAALLLDDLKKADAHSLTFLHDDSWELGAANWTPGFENAFKKANGYDMLAYLPIITGRILQSRDVSNRFLYDFRRTVADLIWSNHYKHFGARAHADGLGFHPEGGGPHPAPIDALKNVGLNDIPMGEFWIRANTHRVSPQSRLYVKQPASAAHIYGKRFVQAEGPTSIGPHWEEDFAYMKPTLDRVYCEGMNRLVLHTFTHSPKEAGIPGNEYFAGTHFNPNVTWWKQAPAFLTWNTRNSFMLSQGLFVGDVCYYYGDNTPNQVPLKHVNEGLGEGYDYDICNTEVILNRMTARNGRICLPDGMSYAVLVLPNRTGITLEVMAKLEKLIRAGATVIGPKPQTSVGLRGYADSEEKVKKLADAVWGSNSETSGKRPYGKGFICTGMSVREVLSSEGIQPDFTYESQKEKALIDYIHRNTGQEDIYYIANRNERPEYIRASFRVEGKIPELWNSITGEITPLTVYTSSEGQTTVPLFLEPFGSTFVIFRAPASGHYVSVTRNGKELFPSLPEDTFHISPIIQGDGGLLTFTIPGEYVCRTATGEERKVTIAGEELIPVSQPWDVFFDPAWGGPGQVRLDKPVLWNQHADPGIRYYSGTVEYNNTFLLSLKQLEGKRAWLDLGELYNLAEVYVNGKQAGVWWQPPFTGDITALLSEGENELKIRVVNLWPNRIIGDQLLPEDKRFTQTNVSKFTRDYPLRPSGLAGPVQIRIYPFVRF